MVPEYDKIHLKFSLNGINYDRDALNEVAYSFIKEGDDNEKSIGNFLLDWLDNKDLITLYTSGSTGPQKLITVPKQSLVASAIASGNFFGLEPGNTALQCLPTKYISGKIMFVRAMILGLALDYTIPESSPIYDPEKKYDFCAMVPLQLRKCLDRISNIKTLIVGGAAVPTDLVEAIQDLPTLVYETYGMTETVSHIALKALNGPDASEVFKVLEGVTLDVDDRGCLIIDAPHLRKEPIVTNDLVELISETEFKMIGRYDNIINSGGVKLNPELIEAKIQKYLPNRFFVASEADKDLGEKLILVVEGREGDDFSKSFSHLEKLEQPKKIYVLKEFAETPTQKIDRTATLKLLKN